MKKFSTVALIIMLMVSCFWTTPIWAAGEETLPPAAGDAEITPMAVLHSCGNPITTIYGPWVSEGVFRNYGPCSHGKEWEADTQHTRTCKRSCNYCGVTIDFTVEMKWIRICYPR